MNQLRKRIGIIWLCLSVAFAIMPYNPVYAEEAREESLAEATQEEKDNEEAKEEKEENQNQQEDDEDTGNADADSDKDLDAEPDADEASEEAAEESENPEDLENESEAEEKEDVQQEPEAEEAFDEVSEEAAESIIISFYVPKDAEGEYELFKKMAADEDGKVIFPDADDLPEIEGLYFAEEWQDEDFNSVDEDMTFEESCRLYALFEEDELPLLKAPVMRAPVQRASSYGIDADNPQVGQVNRYEYTGSNQTWKVPATGYYEIYCYGAQGGTGDWAGRSSSEHGGYSDGNGGYMRASIARITADEMLTIHAGGMGGNGVARNPSDGYGGSGGWNDGARGGHSDNYAAYEISGGGGGGSSYVKNGTVMIIQSRGGNGGGAHNSNNSGFHVSVNGGGGGGSQQLNNADAVVWNTGELDESASNRNSGNGYITIKVIKINPSVKLTQDPGSWTNQEVTITATVTSEGEGLPVQYLSWETDDDGNDIWTDETSYAVSQNGTYTCKIRDVAGNIEETSIEITNIDRLLPEGELLPDTVEWTRDDIELTVNADDAAASPEDGKSGLEDKAYLWGAADSDGALLWEMDADGNEAWTDATAYAASQNGTYACRIRDKAGNISEESIEVTNIDRTAPEIKAEHPTWYSGETTVTWKGLDLQPDGTPGSGLHAEAYSLDGTTWMAEDTQQITAPGTYIIYVRDVVGNVGRYEVELLYDPEPEEKGGKGGDNPLPVTPPEPPKLPEQPKEDASGDGGGEDLIPQPPLPKPPVKAEIFELAVPEVEPELKLPHSPKVKKKKADTMTEIVVDSSCGEGAGHEKLLQAAVMTGAATSGGIILYFVLFFIIRSAGVLALNVDKEYVYIGRRRIIKRGGIYQIYIDAYLYEKADTEYFQIRPGKRFAQKYSGKLMTVKHGDRRIQAMIEEKMNIKIPDVR